MIFALILAILVCAPSFFRWANIAKHADQLRQYAELTEPIFVSSEHEGDQTVRMRAESHRALLLESGNEWQIEVYEYYFREVGHVRESWPQFLQRVEKDETQKLNSWGLRLKSANANVYRAEFLRQF